MSKTNTYSKWHKKDSIKRQSGGILQIKMAKIIKKTLEQPWSHKQYKNKKFFSLTFEHKKLSSVAAILDYFIVITIKKKKIMILKAFPSWVKWLIWCPFVWLQLPEEIAEVGLLNRPVLCRLPGALASNH